MKKIIFHTFLLLMVLFLSCKKENPTEPDVINETKDYLHISHTRTNSHYYMISEVEKIDYTKYNMLWLGGDLTGLTSENDSIMVHVDSVFDVKNNNTLWALGNHDYTDLNRVQNFTERPSYYSYHKNGITIIVLDTQDSLSSIIGDQKAFFDQVVDTIQNSSHLIILHHKLIWMYGDSYLEPQISSISNADFGSCFYCVNPNNFYTEIYPKLLEVKQKGIKVICIAGDIGMKTNEFEYTTPEGIILLASGLGYNSNSNKVLLFHHNLTKKQLTWEFKLINEL